MYFKYTVYYFSLFLVSVIVVIEGNIASRLLMFLIFFLCFLLYRLCAPLSHLVSCDIVLEFPFVGALLCC